MVAWDGLGGDRVGGVLVVFFFSKEGGRGVAC